MFPVFLWFLYLPVMVSKNIAIVCLFVAAFLQATVTTLPLFLIALLVIYVLKKNVWVFAAAFLGGLLLDVAAVRSLGQTSLFFISFLALISFYQRKFEINTLPFILFSAFAGSALFFYLFGAKTFLLQSLTSTAFAAILFLGLRLIIHPRKEERFV